MTITESPPDTDPVVSAPDAAPAGLFELVSTDRHTVVGRLWIGGAVLAFCATAVLGVLVALESVDAADVTIFGGVNAYFRMWSLHRVALALFVVAPLFVGLATVVVPLQVGAPNIAFPRAAVAAWWSWLLGTGITVAAVFAGGGWGALDGVTGDERDAIALTLAGTGLVAVALLLGILCVAATVIALRAPGLTLARVPAFSWSILVTASVWLLTLPVVVADLALAYVDLRGRAPIAFGIPDDRIWGEISWFLGQPQVYAFAIPVLGILAEVVPVAFGVRPRRHGLTLGLIAAFGVLAVGAWAQPAFVDLEGDVVFTAFGVAAVVPVLAALGGAVVTLAGVGPRLKRLPRSWLIGGLVAGDLLLAATAAGLLRVIEPLGLGGTAAEGGIGAGVLLTALVAGAAALWYWAPKITGRLLADGAGRLAVLVLALGALLVAVPGVVNGFLDAPDLLLSAPARGAVDGLNTVAAVGAVVVALGAVVVALALVASLRGGPRAAADPWGGHTLEWATASPPPPGNFTEPPRVTSAQPLLDAPDRPEEA